jgi:hypothetical protein
VLSSSAQSLDPGTSNRLSRSIHLTPKHIAIGQGRVDEILTLDSDCPTMLRLFYGWQRRGSPTDKVGAEARVKWHKTKTDVRGLGLPCLEIVLCVFERRDRHLPLPGEAMNVGRGRTRQHSSRPIGLDCAMGGPCDWMGVATEMVFASPFLCLKPSTSISASKAVGICTRER